MKFENLFLITAAVICITLTAYNMSPDDVRVHFEHLVTSLLGFFLLGGLLCVGYKQRWVRAAGREISRRRVRRAYAELTEHIRARGCDPAARKLNNAFHLSLSRHITCFSEDVTRQEVARWRKHARRVTAYIAAEYPAL